MQRKFSVLMLALVGFAIAFVLGVSVERASEPTNHTVYASVQTRLDREVKPALKYAAWCGGTVSVEPLAHNNHDVVVVGCDK